MSASVLMDSNPRRFPFDASRRLHGQRGFSAVYKAATRKPFGPLLVYSAPNAVGHARLGLSVPRRVGTAVLRNRIKRLLREAFRLTQHEWPAGYDVVLVVRPHSPAPLGDYQQWLRAAMRWHHQQWSRRQRQALGDPPPAQPQPTRDHPSAATNEGDQA